MEIKTCKKCQQEKALTEFSTVHKGKYYSSWCKPCTNQASKEWRLANKEKSTQYQKKWREANREEINRKSMEHYEANKEACKARMRNYIASHKTPYHNVYILINDDYVGVTDNLYNRMLWHKSKGRDTDNYKVIAKFDNRKDAEKLEALLHEQGFKGKHPGRRGNDI